MFMFRTVFVGVSEELEEQHSLTYFTNFLLNVLNLQSRQLPSLPSPQPSRRQSGPAVMLECILPS